MPSVLYLSEELCTIARCLRAVLDGNDPGGVGTPSLMLCGDLIELFQNMLPCDHRQLWLPTLITPFHPAWMFGISRAGGRIL